MLSCIIPAHNEQTLIGMTLQALHDSARACGVDYELVVVDDASTDTTAETAARHGARVIKIEKRQIAAARNAGARAARGDLLLFVDADTWANPAAVAAVVEAFRNGAVGGGCLFQFDGPIPLWARGVYAIAIRVMRACRLVGGCFLFCTRDAFRAMGGFSEECFAAEEFYFRQGLCRQGRFEVPVPLVTTSGRKLRTHSGWEILTAILGLAWHGPKTNRGQKRPDLWYGVRRPDPHDAPE
ncbi:MAG: glycosyltransferase [Planctomycetes bacterium]|nr:glycosyltransferase [Planctomycetota bacterium]